MVGRLTWEAPKASESIGVHSPLKAGIYRYITHIDVKRHDSPSATVHRIIASVTITYYPTWLWMMAILYFVMKKTCVVECPIVVHRWRSQWWIATGAFDSELDAELT